MSRIPASASGMLAAMPLSISSVRALTARRREVAYPSASR
ncbi:hypothetical protein H4W81_007930 [Nonomuraea africana]|uniref:Uncharacterized protein n=1 Tax=Nonomuraea africana TaxID=46171 RepID=A0ABR9KTT4_9ACTN|nr:hypothetical protein [Nonomuraea africana]